MTVESWSPWLMNSAKDPATWAKSDSVYLYESYHLTKVQNLNLIYNAIKIRIEVKGDIPKDDKKVKEVNHIG